MVEFMKTAGLMQKIKRNLAIWKRNNEKKEQDGDSIADSDAENCRPASPQTSLWSYTEEEEEKLNSTSYFETVKKWITPDKIAEIDKGWRKEGPGSTGGNATSPTHDNASGTKNNTDEIPIPKVVERRREEVKLTVPAYPDILFDYAHNLPIPLAFFTPRNLEYTHAYQHTIEAEKHSTTRGTYKVMHLEELKKKLNFVEGGLKGLTYSQATKALDNWWGFEIKREGRNERAFHAKWAQRHTEAFESFPEPEETYHWWKPEEYRIRKERFQYSWTFDEMSYIRVKDHVKLEDLKEEAEKRDRIG
ncbi:hypothetical protein PM082_018393 [Marasmius tenuissimus]|nr:hypothetical protein PM082_018393 [Marasmius tenuissimus]